MQFATVARGRRLVLVGVSHAPLSLLARRAEKLEASNIHACAVRLCVRAIGIARGTRKTYACDRRAHSAVYIDVESGAYQRRCCVLSMVMRAATATIAQISHQSAECKYLPRQ